MRLWLALLIGISLKAQNSCIECHASFPGELGQPAAAFQGDVHSRRGFGCADCHGGDPTTMDPQLSMSPKRGFRGKIKVAGIPKLCARCHSDPRLMRKFNPNVPTDQYAQYQTSVHGIQLAKGDTKVATCVSCHGAHGIRQTDDPQSPVRPLNQPATCGKCHADAQYMAQYRIPTDQVVDYRGSVHWKALEERQGQSSAATCSSCHGSHGASPPQVESMVAVCGICHSRNQELFNKSPHEPVFSQMEQGGCVICHGNHAVKDATRDMLTGPDAICAQCHPSGSAGAQVASEMAGLMSKLENAIARSEDILDRAQRAGMRVADPQAELRQARQALITAQVAMHSFNLQEFRQPVSEGLKIASQTYDEGQAALEEWQTRRIGLGASLVTIAIMITGLILAIRMIERRQRETSL